MFDTNREKMMDLIYEPTLEIIKRLESVEESLSPDEFEMLERLKFSVGIFAMKKAFMAKEDAADGFQKPNQNISY